jgi:hypothetical protein
MIRLVYRVLTGSNGKPRFAMVATERHSTPFNRVYQNRNVIRHGSAPSKKSLRIGAAIMCQQFDEFAAPAPRAVLMVAIRMF